MGRGSQAHCLVCHKKMTPIHPRKDDRSRENNLCPECYALTTVCECGCGRILPLYDGRGTRKRFYSKSCYQLLPEVKEKSSKRMSNMLQKLWEQPEYRDGRTKENHHLWNGGYSRVARGFTEKIRQATKERDGFLCMNPICPHRNEDRPLHVHHKDGNPSNNVLENLITLCDRCHYTCHLSPRGKPINIDKLIELTKANLCL